jgi:hypothetical protein
VQEWDINLGTGQGPSDEIDGVIISWVPTPEVEALYGERSRQESPSWLQRLGD